MDSRRPGLVLKRGDPIEAGRSSTSGDSVALYVVSGARFDEHGEVSRVRWARADGAANRFEEEVHEVDIDRVVRALDHGDTIMMRFPTASGYVSGGRLIRKVLPGGDERIRDENAQPEDRRLIDLPRF